MSLVTIISINQYAVHSGDKISCDRNGEPLNGNRLLNILRSDGEQYMPVNDTPALLYTLCPGRLYVC